MADDFSPLPFPFKLDSQVVDRSHWSGRRSG